METILPEYYQTFKEDPQLILLKVFKDTEQKKHFQAFFVKLISLNYPNQIRIHETGNKKLKGYK